MTADSADSNVSDIVPDGVDAETIHQRIYDHSATDASDALRCPECGSPAVSKTVGGMRAGVESNAEYRCQRCNCSFDGEDAR